MYLVSFIKIKKMKKCPYCYEEIQDEAIKCRFCNEWLDSRNSASGIFSKVKGAIKQQIDDYKSNTIGYLDLPTAEKPLKIDKIILHQNRLVWDNKVFYFRDIQYINFCSKSYTTGSSNSNSIFFSIYFKIEKNLICKIIYNEGHENSIFGKRISSKVREQINLMYKFISKETYKQRLASYLHELVENGYFNYTSKIKIYKNGDIYLAQEYKANLKQAIDNGRLEFGPSFDTNQIFIYKDSGPSGISMWRYLELDKILLNIDLHTDYDVLALLLTYIFRDGELYPDQLARSYLQ